MDKQLVKTLLRVFHSGETRFPASQNLVRFCETYSVGHRKGASLLLNDKAKVEIALLLKGKLGINASSTFPDSWDGKSRSESLDFGNNEKLAGGVVSEGRIQVKALRGRELTVCGGRWSLPDRADLGLDLESLLGSPLLHNSILLVENKQTFHDIWWVREDLLKEASETNSLVVFRGEAEGGSRTDAVNRLISSLGVPVFAFVDFDPAGMVIAAALPGLNKVVAPDLDELSRLLHAYGMSDRFMDQMAAAKISLEKLKSDPMVGPILEVIMTAGKGLPQEFFHRKGTGQLA